MDQHLIYEATNSVNGKTYVGQTSKSLEERKKNHLRDARNGSKLLFHMAIRKYGEDTFRWQIINRCDSKDVANHMEIACIAQNKLKKLSYNISDGGDGCNWNKGLSKEDPRVAAYSEKLKGRSLSESHKANISKSKIGKPSWNKGIPCREETKLKLSECNEGLHEGAKNSMFNKRHSKASKIKIFNHKKAINDDTIRKIKYDLDQGFTCRKVSKKFDISEKTISRIKRGKRYKLVN